MHFEKRYTQKVKYNLISATIFKSNHQHVNNIRDLRFRVILCKSIQSSDTQLDSLNAC